MSFGFPFAALIGQEELQLGLLLNAVNPAIGGILIRGEKGTAKSTAVRGFADLLPEIDVIKGCRFSCDPARDVDWCYECRQRKMYPESLCRPIRLINLPLNVSEDRVAGGIDFPRTIQHGKAILQPGLLASANRGILYVDEINLLDDNIVDIVLDATGTGWNTLEREGLSLSHPARITLIGTMNPEEGELRPQLLDRFGFCVEISSCEELDQRVELLRHHQSFELCPQSFRARFAAESQRLRQQIRQAREQLPLVRMPTHLQSFIGELCLSNQVAGHRADLVMEQAALALAALEGEAEVNVEQIRRVATMVLSHRQREALPPATPPPATNPSEQGRSEENNHPSEDERTEPAENQPSTAGDTTSNISGQEQDSKQTDNSDPILPQTPQEESQPDKGPSISEQVFAVGNPFKVKNISSTRDRKIRRGSGRRSRSRVSQKQGRYSRSGRRGVPGDVALDATLRAAAPFQQQRSGDLAIKLQPQDLRFKLREKRLGNLLLFIVDASGSMGARGRMAASKGAVMSLLLDAYQKRDKVAMITFRRDQAFVNLPITSSVELAGKLLNEMPVGGRTPLSAGLIKGYEQVRNYLIREPAGRPIIIILTDGKGNVSLGADKPINEMLKLAKNMSRSEQAKYVVVDTEDEGLVTFGLAARLATALGADYFKIKDLQAEELVRIAQERQ